jgi:PadR family transcriptional regulator, regulatory protein PadR
MAIEKELLKGSSKTLILQLLIKSPKHGYELTSQIKKITSGAIEISEGTIYPALHSLEADGFVTSTWTDGEGKRKRKVYRITPQGKKLLKEKKESWFKFAAAMAELLPVKRMCWSE